MRAGDVDICREGCPMCFMEHVLTQNRNATGLAINGELTRAHTPPSLWRPSIWSRGTPLVGG